MSNFSEWDRELRAFRRFWTWFARHQEQGIEVLPMKGDARRRRLRTVRGRRSSIVVSRRTMVRAILRVDGREWPRFVELAASREAFDRLHDVACRGFGVGEEVISAARYYAHFSHAANRLENRLDEENRLWLYQYGLPSNDVGALLEEVRYKIDSGKMSDIELLNNVVSDAADQAVAECCWQELSRRGLGRNDLLRIVVCGRNFWKARAAKRLGRLTGVERGLVKLFVS